MRRLRKSSILNGNQFRLVKVLIKRKTSPTTMAFFAVVGTLACLNMAAGFALPAPPCKSAPVPVYAGAACPKPAIPVIEPTVITQVAPAPVTIGLPLTPAVLEHQAAPYEINYFEKPYIVKHVKSAALNVFTQTPVVVDEYAAPAFNEVAAPPAVIVEQVCPAVAAPAPCASAAPVAYAPAPCH